MAELRRRSHRVRLLLCLALLFSVCLWLGQQITWKEKEIDIGQSTAARQNNFLAAQYFLQEQGVASQLLRSFSLLDNLAWQEEQVGQNDTLILINAYKLLQGKRLQNLLNWIENGGIVITGTSNQFIGNNTRTRDPLFDQLGVDVIRKPSTSEDDTEEPEDITETEKSEEDDPQSVDNAEEPHRCDIEGDLTLLDLFADTEPLLIDFSQGEAFLASTATIAEVGDDLGLHLAVFEYGEGWIIVHSDPSIWSNARIDCHDHAYALWKILHPTDKVWFLVNQEAPSLLALLWRVSPVGIGACILALLLWLWAKARRFGPVLSRAEAGRRSLAEHIRASATLLWRHKQHPYLIEQMRRRLREQVQRSHAQFSSLSEPEQVQLLQALTGMPTEQIHRGLFSDQVESSQDFTETVAHLQNIRKHL